MILEIGVIVALLLALTVSVGINIVTISSLRYVKRDLPEMVYGVGSALIDDKAKQFMGDMSPSGGGGRPAEGGLGKILELADKFGIIDKLFAKKGSSSSGGSTFGR